MFLFERLFGIGMYMLVLILACLALAKTNGSCKAILRVYLLCLCVMAFLYKPYVTADLYRIFRQMDYFATMDFDLFWREYAMESSVPASRLLFWLFGKTGVNALLPAFSAFACYSCIFYVINKTKQRYDVSNQTVAIVLFFIMTTSMFISVIGGIRMMLALSMLSFSYFRATVEKKITVVDIFFFVISIFIHEMSFGVLGVIALTMLFDSDRNALKKIGYVLAMAVIGLIFVIEFTDTLRGLYAKFLDYVLGDKHSDPWEYIMGFFMILILLLVFWKFRAIRREEDCRRVSKCHLAAIFCVLLAVCFCFEFSIFYRFGGHMAILFAIPSMMISLERTKGKPGSRIKVMDMRTMVLMFSLIIAAVSCARGSLCSLKFFVL